LRPRKAHKPRTAPRLQRLVPALQWRTPPQRARLALTQPIRTPMGTTPL